MVVEVQMKNELIFKFDLEVKQYEIRLEFVNVQIMKVIQIVKW